MTKGFFFTHVQNGSFFTKIFNKKIGIIVMIGANYKLFCKPIVIDNRMSEGGFLIL
jgi:hypothetical protein